jgi:uncharacterized protein (TIGR03435 family)
VITSACKWNRNFRLLLGLAASVSAAALSHAQILHPENDGPSFEVATNRTGLKGSYDFTLKWSPDSSTPSDSDEPSLFTAIREQLGVRFVPSKAPVEVLAVEHIEHPSPN